MWADIHVTPILKLNKDEIKKQMIWNNSLLRSETKPLYYKERVKNEIFRVEDILDPKDQNLFLNYDNFLTKYNNATINFLDFERIRSLSKKLFKATPKEDENLQNSNTETFKSVYLVVS